MTAPKVSVCIPTYNSAQFLPDAINSAFAQTFTDYEVIVCDNASTDNTLSYCETYKHDSRFRYVRFEDLVGQGGNWNRCLRLARGEYIALLHADDRYLPNFLQERVSTLDSNPQAGVAFGAVRLIDKYGTAYGQTVFRPEPFVVPAPEFFSEILMGCLINPASVVVRKECYASAGWFDEGRLWGIDWDMWLRLSARFGVAYSPVIAAEYRTHDVSGTSAGLPQAKNGPEELEVLNAAIREMNNLPQLARFRSLKRAAFRKLALRTIYCAGVNCELGNVNAVRTNLYWSLKADPTLASRPSTWVLWCSSFVGSWLYRAVQRIRRVPTNHKEEFKGA